MEINSSQAANAYTTAPNTTPAVDNANLKVQSTEPVQTDLNTENENTAQKPFEVNITQEARDRLAAEATQEQVEVQTDALAEEQIPQPEPRTEEAPATAQETSQIVNIVA